MITWNTQPKPNALVMTLSGEIGRDEIRQAIDGWRKTHEAAGLIDMLVIVEGRSRLTFAALLEDLAHMSESLAAIPSAGRIGLVSAPGWITTIARIERALIPGFHLEVYPAEALDRARAWVLREIGSPTG